MESLVCWIDRATAVVFNEVQWCVEVRTDHHIVMETTQIHRL